VADAISPTVVELEIKPPKRFGFRALLAVHLYGVVLVIPVLSGVVALSLLPPGYGPLFLPLAGLALTILFLPLGMGNSYISRLVRSFSPEGANDEGGHIVQLTLTPRLRAGLRGLLEDADDIGFLSFDTSALVFRGDSIRFAIPYKNLCAVQPQNIGMRGLFIYGRRIEVRVDGVPGVEALRFAERSSLLLPGSRRRTQLLRRDLASRTLPASVD
jgi:hypothetical protein